MLDISFDSVANYGQSNGPATDIWQYLGQINGSSPGGSFVNVFLDNLQLYKRLMMEIVISNCNQNSGSIYGGLQNAYPGANPQTLVNGSYPLYYCDANSPDARPFWVDITKQTNGREVMYNNYSYAYASQARVRYPFDFDSNIVVFSMGHTTLAGTFDYQIKTWGFQ